MKHKKVEDNTNEIKLMLDINTLVSNNETKKKYKNTIA